ncbi:hypothetical protein [Deinococcus hopiensis]|uniref:Uncharacterized protein n=1 Tax=Deinococcus hopiensis KR-140 TaxID=695939 RepID=A0A1W1UD60_9DEIO|nr:hypothetical protein [Deinococcus hopiensis]SMB78999.1 hypothetical protein SAMN00790413_05720 [Deinococcus hopiensis KR-140]
MTSPALRNGVKPPDAPTSPTYELLCQRARALGHDAAFLSLLRRPGLDLNTALRFALDAVPALELLPLPVLAEELRVILARARCTGRGSTVMVRVWLA